MADKIFQIKTKILKNIEVAPKYFKVLLDAPAIAKSAKPGQFVEIKVSDGYAPLLRRPLSIHRVGQRGALCGLRMNNGGHREPDTENRTPRTIEILYEVVGQGTEILSQKRAGEYLDVIGPLGNGFNYESQVTGHKSQVLVAGGMGVAPLLFLAQRLAYSVERRAYSKKLSAIRYPLNAQVFIGAKTKSAILCEKEFKALGCDVQIATDDGSKGFKGRVTGLLSDVLRETKGERRKARDERREAIIYGCGPKAMLKEIASISKEHNLLVQVSLEAHMACGIGACLGCVVNTRDGYKRVCKEGPVFAAQDIVW